MVCVLSADGAPLDPCHPARARQLLTKQRAVVVRRFPLTIRLGDRTCAESTTGAFRLKLDPGSKTTGIAVVNEQTAQVVVLAELHHRGQQVRDALFARRQFRHARRQRKTRYRAPRLLNRRRLAGWCAPSLQSRIDNVCTWVRRLRARIPITALSVETVRFDTQLLSTPDISGVLYQQGTLAGYELREYLLERWKRTCAYCGAMAVPLQIEHIVPRSRGGSDRVSNLTLACAPCNLDKGNRTAAEYGHPHLHKQATRPLRDAAAVNSTRWALFEQLVTTGLPVEMGTGGRTKFNRRRLGLPKTHWLDALCVGTSTPAGVRSGTKTVLAITATGRGLHARTKLDRYGFPRLRLPRQKRWFGFQTGDIVRAVVPAGKHVGTHVGRVAVRSSGSFNITTASGIAQGIHHRHCRVVQRADGYRYGLQAVRGLLAVLHQADASLGLIPPTAEAAGFLRRFL